MFFDTWHASHAHENNWGNNLYTERHCTKKKKSQTQTTTVALLELNDCLTPCQQLLEAQFRYVKQ